MVQGFGIGMLLKRLSEFSLLILAVLISGCAFVLMVGSLRYTFLYFNNCFFFYHDINV